MAATWSGLNLSSLTELGLAPYSNSNFTQPVTSITFIQCAMYLHAFQ